MTDTRNPAMAAIFEQHYGPAAPAPEPKLAVEMVPSSCWFSNVRSQVSTAQWDVLRRAVYAAANHRCETCGATGVRLACHEKWDYDLPTRVQRLVTMVALCTACHEVKHMGLANTRGRGNIAVAHLQKVNGWTGVQAALHCGQQGALFRQRSAVTWTLDLSALQRWGITLDPTPPEQR